MEREFKKVEKILSGVKRASAPKRKTSKKKAPSIRRKKSLAGMGLSAAPKRKRRKSTAKTGATSNSRAKKAAKKRAPRVTMARKSLGYPMDLDFGMPALKSRGRRKSPAKKRSKRA